MQHINWHGIPFYAGRSRLKQHQNPDGGSIRLRAPILSIAPDQTACYLSYFAQIYDKDDRLGNTMQIFRAACPARPMRRPWKNDDELRQMQPEDGMINLEVAAVWDLGLPNFVEDAPDTRETANIGRFLWVVGANETPVALEGCVWGLNLENGVIKHSNLTGGAPAHSGGELWVVQGQGLIVNANSGRYGARTPEELDAFVEALNRLGFRAASMGFDIDNLAVPNAVQVGPVEWRDPNV